MKKITAVWLLLSVSIISLGQISPYQFVKTISGSQTEVSIQVAVHCDSKKELDHAAFLAGIRCVLFDGIPNTVFSRPLLSEGEKTSIEKHPSYFDDLYGWRYTDYIKECVMISKFKKSGIGKSTLFEITIKALDLRKDLEKNRIKTKLGI